MDAVRALFDDHQQLEPSIEEISRAVGINKATIYRHVATKDELLLLVQCSYQQELLDIYHDLPEIPDLLARVEEFTRRYVAFCQRYPAYVDLATSLMRRGYTDLAESASPAVLLQLTQSIAAVNSTFARTVAAGIEDGTFTTAHDPDQFTALASSMTLGAMQVLRFGISARQGPGDFPETVVIDAEKTVEILVDLLRTALGAAPRR